MKNIKSIICILIAAALLCGLSACSKESETNNDANAEIYKDFWDAMPDDFPQVEGRRETLGKYEYILEDGLAKDICFYNYSCKKNYNLEMFKLFFEENPDDNSDNFTSVMEYVDWIRSNCRSDEYEKFRSDFAVFYTVEFSLIKEGLPYYADLTGDQVMEVGSKFIDADYDVNWSVFGL